MKWLERLRAKTGIPTGGELTKLTKVPVAGSVSVPSGGAAVVSISHDPSPVEIRDYVAPAGHLPVNRSSATASISPDLDRAGQSIAAPKLESIRVAHQPLWYDFDVPDGTYTPQELRRAGKVVKSWGPVQYYTLQWPALEARVLNLPIRSAPMSCSALRRENTDEPTDDGLTKLTKGR